MVAEQEFTSAPPGPESVDWRDLETGETHPVEEPKKRRGRPPKDPNAPPRPRATRTTTRRGRSLADEIGGTLYLMNLAFAFMPDPWRGDMLDDVEIKALAESLDEAARSNPTMHRYLSAVLVSGGSMANLVMVAALIGGRRLARHGVIDAELDDRLATFLASKMGLPTNDVASA